MLVGMTPSTHDGRRKLFAGVDGGEFTGEMVTSSGADPLRFDSAIDAANPSSSDDFVPEESPGRDDRSALHLLPSRSPQQQTNTVSWIWVHFR